jgi:hypothetical protein
LKSDENFADFDALDIGGPLRCSKFDSLDSRVFSLRSFSGYFDLIAEFSAETFGCFLALAEPLSTLLSAFRFRSGRIVGVLTKLRLSSVSSIASSFGKSSLTRFQIYFILFSKSNFLLKQRD